MAFTHLRDLKDFMLGQSKHEESPSMASFKTIFDDLSWSVLLENDVFFLNHTFFLEICVHSGDQTAHKELMGHVKSRLKTL